MKWLRSRHKSICIVSSTFILFNITPTQIWCSSSDICWIVMSCWKIRIIMRVKSRESIFLNLMNNCVLTESDCAYRIENKLFSKYWVSGKVYCLLIFIKHQYEILVCSQGRYQLTKKYFSGWWAVLSCAYVSSSTTEGTIHSEEVHRSWERSVRDVNEFQRTTAPQIENYFVINPFFLVKTFNSVWCNNIITEKILVPKNSISRK